MTEWFISGNFVTNGMNESRFVLDTNAVIFLTTRGNAIHSELLEELNSADLFVSVITEIELLAKPKLLPEEEENLLNLLSEIISVIDLNTSIKKETIVLRRNSKLKLPDCIIVATAITLNATLLTADEELLHLDWPGYLKKRLTANK